MANQVAKLCPGCPYWIGNEATEMAYNLGCLPSQGEVNQFVGSDHVWPCHSEPTKVCAGWNAEHPDRKDQPLKHMDGVHVL